MQRHLRANLAGNSCTDDEKQQQILFLQRFPTINYAVAAILLRGYSLRQLALSSAIELTRYLVTEELHQETIVKMISSFVQLLRAHIGLEMRI